MASPEAKWLWQQFSAQPVGNSVSRTRAKTDLVIYKYNYISISLSDIND